MKLIKKGDLNILTPEDGFELVNKNTGICSDKVYLGKSDSLDNYIERKKENYISDLSILKEQKDIEVHVLMDVIDSLILLLESLSILPLRNRILLFTFRPSTVYTWPTSRVFLKPLKFILSNLIINTHFLIIIFNYFCFFTHYIFTF